MALTPGYLAETGMQPVSGVACVLSGAEEGDFPTASSSSKKKPVGKWHGASVRETFIKFFQEKCKHSFVPSSPVVPHNDPTLLFINAGMNQFKPIFVGQIDPSHPFAKLKRAANSQKCIRAGGKHNDLEDVGKDVYHHTFFEMLGNWSFGDYFKKDAIDWAWELLTKVYGMDPSRLYATYYGGDPKQPSVPSDEEAREMWKKYLPESRILPFDMKDNFWEMGDTGPCGPCTEIHYDRIGGRDAAHLVNMDDPDVLEIWNLVFMQYNRENDGSLTTLPAQSVDTGAGLERVTSVLMDKRSNYDTDLFTEIFDAIQAKTGCRDYTGKVGDEDTDHVDMAYRVIADHIRTLTIALTDGAVPSNDGRGYVLRRILRRAVRYGREILGAKPGFFHTLVDSVLDTLGDAFPTLRENPEDVKAIIKDEEEQFGRTLEKGTAKLKAFASKGNITGDDAFLLFTSYGFPVDLTELMAAELKVEVDMPGFEARMQKFREDSKASGTFKNRKDMTLMAAQTDELGKKMALATTDESAKYTWDSAKGDGSEMPAKVMAIYDGKEFIKSCKVENETVGIVLDKTPCYAEQGGQTFDTAEITTAAGAEFKCEDAQKYAGFVLHIGTMTGGEIKVGDAVGVKVDYARRALIAKNHTATHILNYALRAVLGDKIDQKGSLNDEYKLRFDFSYGKPIETEELNKIEEICNREIQKAHKICFQEVALGKAKAIGGLRAVFGETYPDPVRVVSVGPEVDAMLADSKQLWGVNYSVEFCGGTHVNNSSEIYKFVLQVEEGIAKGVRRIVAVTGPQAAVEATLKTKALSVEVDEAKTLMGALLEKKIAEMRNKISTDKEVSLVLKRKMLGDIDKLKEKQLAGGKAEAKAVEKKAKEIGEQIADEAAKASGDMYVGVVDAGVFDDGKAVAFAEGAASKKCTTKAMFFISNAGGKLAVLAVVPKDLKGKVSAKAWTGAVLEAIGGKGGGNDDKAQGQVSDPAKFDEALAKAKEFMGSGGGGGGFKPAERAAPQKEGKKDKGAKEEAKPAASPEEEAKKKLKKVKKEGGKRGVEIEGAADMGGLQFFCTSVDEPEGDIELCLKCMEAMNEKSDPTEEERKGGSGHIGKMVFSAGVHQLALVAYVPEAKQAECSCEEWLEKVLSLYPTGKMVDKAKDVCTAFIPTDSDKNIFPLKIREPMILEANNFLRKKGLFPEDNGDDSDEMVFGDDDFPSM